MSYIGFDKLKLINLEYALDKELLRSNRFGAFSSTTIIGCNTRKYHGALIAPQPFIDNDNHVLLSSLDETIIQREAEFNLGIRKYRGSHYNPKGHKYMKELNADPIPKITYRVGGVILTKEILLAHENHMALFRYTLIEAHSPTKIRLKPFLAFRNTHSLSKANLYVNTHYENIQNGVSYKLYNGYTPLMLQFSKPFDYTHVPDWYYNIEYYNEIDRGYDGHEDLLVPGFFDIEIKTGESIVVAVGIEEQKPQLLQRFFNKEIKTRTPRTSFENCLVNSAQQFVNKKGKKVEIIAGFPWYERKGRDVFISLSGISLSIDNPKLCKMVLDNMIEELKDGLFPHLGQGAKASYNAPDASFWFFWALQEYSEFTKSKGLIWREYNKSLKNILESFKQSHHEHMHMAENKLIYVKEPGVANTWMDAYVEGKPVNPRYGFTVETNALWFNAVCFAIEVATLANDTAFVEEWTPIKNDIKTNFNNTFCSSIQKHLADYVDGDFTDWSIRPNQIIATSLPYSPLDEDKKMDVIQTVKKELLTHRGLRTLSPQDTNYQGVYEGNAVQRESAAFQGTVYPWLIGHYAYALYNTYGDDALQNIKELLFEFEETMWEHGIGSVSELYDGNPPHKPNGAISHASSIAELLRIFKLLKNKQLI